jgi:hypothetical protein
MHRASEVQKLNFFSSIKGDLALQNQAMLPKSQEIDLYWVLSSHTQWEMFIGAAQVVLFLM